MKKLCLILTVLYAFGANCSAQSLYIAKNLLEGNSSTFNSGWGGWEDQGSHCGKSLVSTGGPDRSQCARLAPTANATENYNAQLRYTFAATQGTTYVFRLKAKKVSGNGTIQAIMQHNSGGFEQQHFFDKDVSENWATYEGEVTAERSDYNVIMINYGKCGDVLIDDIEFGVKTVPTFTTNLETSYTVGQGGTLTLSVKASGTPAPEYQWYRNTTNSNENGTEIQGETSATYSVPTGTKDTYYYYCVATNAEGSATSNVATVDVTDPIPVTKLSLTAPNTMNVGTNEQCIVTIAPDNATNKNVTWESSDVSIIEVDQNGKLTAKSTGTATITVSSQDDGGVIPVSKEITVLASNSANGTYVENGMFYMLEDFGNAAVNDKWDIINHESYQVTQPGSAKIVTDPKYGNVLDFKSGNNVTTEYLVFHCKLPEGKTLSDFSSFVFDYKAISNDRNHKEMKFYWSGIDWSGKTYPTFKTGDETHSPWHTGTIKLTDDIKTDKNEFDLYIGGIPTYLFEVLITNIRLATDGSYTQNDFSNTWSKVESETLYVTGSGPMPDFNGNQPWSAKNNSITKVIVSENITAIGNNAFNGLTQDNVVIILKSIPDRFGENCFKNSYDTHTRILQLELHDEEKPYISNEVASSNFPTFDKATYFRDVKNNYSTVCLPFPISSTEVSNKKAKLYDFTSMGKATVGGEDQYTLEFKGHTGGMAAGQPYLIGSGNIVLSNDEGTKVKPEDFILTPTKVTKSVENTDVSITMEGVFQPVVIDKGYAYGFLEGKFYMNGGNMSVRPMRASFNGSQLYSAPVQGGQAKKMPKMFNFEIVPDNVTHISSPAFIAEDFNIEEVYSPSGMKTESLNKGLNIIRTSTGRVLKVMVK